MASISNFGKTFLGIEFGSTTIKLVLIDEKNQPLAVGKHVWENQLVDNVWTYSLEAVHEGLKLAYADLKSKITEKFGTVPTTFGVMGISAMMHGYIALDENDELLVPFRTWRNTMTEQATEELNELFKFNIPQRWSVAHLYQAILNGEPHTKKIKKVMTLAAYLHYKLTGNYVLGVGDASGMFPIDSTTRDYNQAMVDKFDALLKEKGYDYGLRDIFPKVMVAGEVAGFLTADGASMLDSDLQQNIRLCPPEGDAGTGMVATNSIELATGNVSAGTSIFAMVVLEKALSTYYKELDIVTTPEGFDVAMVHCNNCSSDIDAWARVFSQFAKTIGVEINPYKALDAMFEAAEDDVDYSGLLNYNYLSGEHITGLSAGRPMFVRKPDAEFSFATLSKAQIYSTLATLKIGFDILFEKEGVKLTKLMGHGGFFKADFGSVAMAAASNASVSVMESAGEGGAYGIAILAAFTAQGDNKTLREYLSTEVYSDAKMRTSDPDKKEAEMFVKFLAGYKKGIEVQKCAVEKFV